MLNKVFLIGRLTRDPELRRSQSGTDIVGFGLAVNRSYKKNDERQEETTFVDVTVFGNQATTVSEYCVKGKQVLVEGRLNLDRWEDQDGNKRSRLTVIADRVQFLSGDRAPDDSATTAPAAASDEAADNDLPF